jgi:hypothetical protein
VILDTSLKEPIMKKIEILSVSDMPHTEDHDWSRSVCEGCAHETVSVMDARGEILDITGALSTANAIGMPVLARCVYDDEEYDALAAPTEDPPFGNWNVSSGFQNVGQEGSEC